MPRWQADFVVQKYFDLYSYLYPDVPHISQVLESKINIRFLLLIGSVLILDSYEAQLTRCNGSSSIDLW